MNRTRKRIISALLALTVLFSAVFLASCDEDSDYPVTVGGITIDCEPQNVVILDKNIADIVTCMEYETKIAGRSDEVSQKDLKIVPSVGAAASPSVEKIAKLKADVVLANDSFDKAIEKKLNEKGIPVVKFNSANTPKQLKNLYRRLGIILGGENSGADNADEYYTELMATYKELKDTAENSTTVQITTCYLYIDQGVLKTVSKGSWGDTLLGFTGTFNVFKNEDSNVIEPEKLRLANPDFIFCDSDEVVEYLKNSEVLNVLDALESRTVVVPYEDFTTQGYTGLSAMRKILGAVYPSGKE